MLRYLLISVLLLAAITRAGEPVRMVSRGDETASYAEAMIRLALDKADEHVELDIRPGSLSAARQLRDTRRGVMDVMWSATSKELEAQLIPIRVPLFKGLIGHRVFLLHPDNRDQFESVTRLDELREFTYGQGVGWPDTRILKDNGFEVRAESYGRLTMMVHGKRFDVFPRGVSEPWGEMERQSELDLAVDEHILLVYRMPFYLFVTPERPELARALRRGLMAAVEDGDFDELFYGSSMVRTTLQRADLSQRRVFYLENRSLPEATPVDDDRLWVSIADLKARERQMADQTERRPE